MKVTGISILLFSIAFSLNGQNTRMQKLTWNVNTWGYNDTITGVKTIAESVDGSLFVLANTSCHYSQYIYKFNPNRYEPEWNVFVGYSGMSFAQYADVLKPTSDSGIIICFNNKDKMPGYNTVGFLKKYSKDGALQWSRQFGQYMSWVDWIAFDVVENSQGGYYALIDDSMYTLDAAGNLVDSTGLISGTRLLEMTNGDFLVQDGNFLVRTDVSGNVIWSQSCNGPFACDTTSVFLVNNGSYIKKVNAQSGAQIWVRNYGHTPFSGLEATHDGGVMASVGYKPAGPFTGSGTASPGYLIRCDSLGDTLWTREYSLPHFGLSCLKILSNGNIATGGCYFSGHVPFGSMGDPAAFWSINEPDGIYPLQLTSYVSPPDADNNHQWYFVDDALDVMLALGRTGTARDTAADGAYLDFQFGCGVSDLAVDWPTSSGADINDKYKDLDGNGVVDTSDIHCFTFCDWDSTDIFYRMSDPALLQSPEEFCLIPVNDTIFYGDSPFYYMILGSASNPVDSIYGFAFSYHVDGTSAERINALNSDLGIPGTDVYTYLDQGQIGWSGVTRMHTLVSRTDVQDAYSVWDTVGILRLNELYNDAVLQISMDDFKAILADGTEIPFTFCTEPVVVMQWTSVAEESMRNITISPNPASDRITISHSFPAGSIISIFNSLGKKIRYIVTDGPQTDFTIEDLPEGYYTGKIASAYRWRNFSFIKMH